MKVTIFETSDTSQLEKAINDFMHDETNDFASLVDIKYSACNTYSGALLIYHEKLEL